MSRKKWKDLRGKHLSNDAAKASYEDARKKLDRELADHALGLADLRRARNLTQKQVSLSMGVSQAQVSRVENQADYYLSTLRSFIEAMGGELRLMVVFPDMADAIEVDLPDVTGVEHDDAPEKRRSEPPQRHAHVPVRAAGQVRIRSSIWDDEVLRVDDPMWMHRTRLFDEIIHQIARNALERHPAVKGPKRLAADLKQSEVDKEFEELTQYVD
jgi:transcriptional regulator with XRE-family HTH domain